ncbi:hypothetical protein C725_2201 [Pacificimonas flava]|uniref:Uncharacterized protein n=2 Tax=Pacificimonas flava TaxID=1234595 RepID=M2SAR9_9SPHN|nr:hypothetical protein C725_2201 [Pacificimonas flava]
MRDAMNGLAQGARRLTARRVRQSAERAAERIERDLGLRATVDGGDIRVRVPRGRRLADARLRWPAAWLGETGG